MDSERTHAEPPFGTFASGKLWSHFSRIAGCSALRIAAVGTPGGEQMRAGGCLRSSGVQLEMLNSRRPGNRLRAFFRQGYELVAFQCQLLIIAVRLGASVV